MEYGFLTCCYIPTRLYDVNPDYNMNYKLFHTTCSMAFKWVMGLIPRVKTAGEIFHLYPCMNVTILLIDTDSVHTSRLDTNLQYSDSCREPAIATPASTMMVGG
jgi:hypothetical protein